MLTEERQSGLCPEVHIGLVDDHGPVYRVVVKEVPDPPQGKGDPGRCVGVGKDDPAGVPLEVFLHADGEPIIQGDALELDAVEVAVHGIEAVSEGRKKQLSTAAVEEGIETKGERLVGTIPHKTISLSTP